jgi:general secretion pathway protein K
MNLDDFRWAATLRQGATKRGQRGLFASMWREEKGIALPLVLWFVTILSAIVFSFAVMARTETRAAFNFKEGVEKKLLAEGGIERGIMEVAYISFFATQSATPGQKPALEEFKVWKTDGTPYRAQVGKGYSTMSIIDESGKIPINALTDGSGIILRNLLIRLGSNEEEAETIIDSILDWRDPDELHRLHGAESDYYTSLPNSYRAKNGNVDTLEELLLVRGVTREVLFGSATRKALMQYISVHSKKMSINVMAAPREVLLSIPGVTDGAAERLLAYRESSDILPRPDIRGLVGEGYAAASPYIGTSGENIYTITSVGQKEGEKYGYTVTAAVTIDETGRHRYLYYKSPSEVNQ